VDSETALVALTNLLKIPSDPQRRFSLLGWAFRALGVRLPKAELNAHGTAPERVEHHPGRARVHRVVSKEPPDGIARAIRIVDAVVNPDLVAVPGPIFDHAQD
jgi:hypothetical protein